MVKPLEVLNSVSHSVPENISSDTNRMPLKTVNDPSQATKARQPFPTGTAFKQLFTKKITISKTLTSASTHFKPLFSVSKESAVDRDAKRQRTF